MKQLLFLLLFPAYAVAQYPGNANQKITLGEQTTADGLVYRGLASDTTRKPSVDTMAYILLDTNTNIIWQYKKATSNAWTRLNLLPSDTTSMLTNYYRSGRALGTPTSGTLTNVTGLPLTSGVTGVLTVANGGTNRTTMPNGYILHGDGTSIDTAIGLFYDRINRRLGVGTSNPAQIIELSTGSFVTRMLITNTENGFAGAGIQFRVINGGTTVSNATIRVDNDNNLNFFINDNQLVNFTNNLRVGIALSDPTSRLHLPAGTATANTAPLKFTSGTNLTTAEAGAMEFNGTNLFFSPSTTRHTVNHGLTGSATLDFPSTTTLLSADLTITVTGASDGDVVSLGVPNAAVNANTCYTAWVSSANTVTVRFNNYSSGTVNPASGTFKVFVTK